MENKNTTPEELPENIAREAAREKSIRYGSPNLLHRWWARRPLILSRIATYLALTDKQTVNFDFLESLGEINPKADVISNAKIHIRDNQWQLAWTEKQYNLKEESFEIDVPVMPKVLDPFAGGGSISLEATRLGCHSFANELSPVAYHILKATLQYPVELHQPNPDTPGTSRDQTWNGLIEEIRYWVERVNLLATQQLLPIFPKIKHEDITPNAYIWFQTVTCSNSKCGIIFPLQESLVLNKENLTLTFEQLNGNLTPQIFERVSNDITNKSSRHIVCPSCYQTIINSSNSNKVPLLAALVSKQGNNNKFTVVSRSEKDDYAPWSVTHQERLNKLLNQDFAAQLQTLLPKNTYSLLIRQGFKSFSDLFSPRQLLVALEFMNAIKVICAEMESAKMLGEQISALKTYLSFFIDYLVEHNSLLSKWMHSSQQVGAAFTHVTGSFQKIYAELTPFDLTDRWLSNVAPSIANAASILVKSEVSLADATKLPFEDDYFDAIVTDPPYYDAVPYMDLSQFYWVWESGILSDITPYSSIPSQEKNTSNKITKNSSEKYQQELLAAMQEAFRVLKPGRLFTMILTTGLKQSFDEYVVLAQKAGFELNDVKSLNENLVNKIDLDFDQSTFLIYFRKVLPNQFRERVKANTTTLLDNVKQGKPVLYEGLAKLLINELDDEIITSLIPADAKGTKIEKVMEVLANLDLRSLLTDQLGRNGIRKLAKQLSETEESNNSDYLHIILKSFNLSLPSINNENGLTQILELLNQMQAKVKFAKDKTIARAAFLDASNAVERIIKLSIWGWAQVIFRQGRDNILLNIINKNAQKHNNLSRLSFGHILMLFRELPNVVASSEQSELIIKKFGRSHIYLPSNKKTKFSERIERIVNLRNKMEHDKDGFYSLTHTDVLRNMLVESIMEAKELIVELASDNVIPRLVQCTHEIKDHYGRVTYKLYQDDGIEVEIYMSTPLKLGDSYLYFGNENTTRPIDPLMLHCKELDEII